MALLASSTWLRVDCRLPTVILQLIAQYTKSITVQIYRFGASYTSYCPHFELEVNIDAPVRMWRECICVISGNPSDLFFLYHRQKSFRLQEDLTLLEQTFGMVCDADGIEMLPYAQSEKDLRLATILSTL